MPSDKPSLIEALQADFKARRRKETLLGFDVWISPLTVEENMLLMEREPAGGANRIAEILLMKCTDESGAPVFNRADKDALAKNVAGEHVNRLVTAITGPSAEAQAKN